MNFLTLGMKTHKKCTDFAQKNTVDMNDKNEWLRHYDFMADVERTRIIKAMDIGLEYFDMFKKRMAQVKDENGRCYMITVRPDTSKIKFCNFRELVTQYLNKWSNKWIWWEYTFEQKGNSSNTIGNGFHMHLIICTASENYYPSHLLRDCYSQFNICTAKNCIQIDTIKNLARAKEYIRGDKKDDDKLKCIAYDIMWRNQNNLENIYIHSNPELAVKSIPLV